MENLKKYCKSRKLNFVKYNEKENWKIVGFKFSNLPYKEEIFNISNFQKMEIAEFLMKQVDEEFNKVLKFFNMNKINKISMNEKNEIVIC